ncbi:MAG: YkvA family protein [Janthinobacterium lividum]
MAILAQRGVQISKDAIFGLFLGRATKIVGKPFKVITILNEAADKLADKNSKDNKFKQLFDVALTLVRMVRNYVKGDYRGIETSTIVSGIAVLLYVISPIDLVPDFIPVLGFLDDLAIISWFMDKFRLELNLRITGSGKQGQLLQAQRFRHWATPAYLPLLS